jgi:hypothetical protein
MSRYLWCERNESSASAHGHTADCYAERPVPASVAAEEALSAKTDGYELWDSDTGNIIGAYRDLGALVAAAYDLGRANPDEPPALSAVDGRQIAARSRPASVEGERRSATVEAAREYIAWAESDVPPHRTFEDWHNKSVVLLRDVLAALPASTESGSRVDVERLSRLADTAFGWWSSKDFGWFTETFPVDFISGPDWGVDYREFAAWVLDRLAPSEPEAPEKN